jgi:two-component sensor histidine kinase
MQAGSGARHLLAISVLFALAAVGTTAAMIVADRAGTIREAQQRNVVLAQLLEEHARRAFDISKASLIDLSGRVMATGKPKVSPDVVARMTSWIKDIPQIFSFWLYDAAGRVVYTTQQVETTDIDYSDREYFKAHRAGADLHVGPMTRGRIDKIWFFSLSKRLADRDGNFQGVLLASMRTDYFGSLFNRLGLGPNENIAISRTDGAVVVRRLANWTSDVAPNGASHPKFTTYISTAPSGVFEAASPIDNVNRIGAYRVVEGWPLLVSAASDKDEMLAAWRSRALRSAAFCTMVLFLIGFLTWWGYRRISGETRALAAASASATRNAVLLNEIHHRVKNNLTIIQSLLLLEANLAPPEMRHGYQDSVARIEAMGLVHKLLYQTQDFEGLDAAEYLRRLCHGLESAALGHIQIITEANQLEIGLDTAIPLALIVNELVTNALKHAFANNEEGEVLVRLQCDGPNVTLLVQDNGCGLAAGIDPARSKGLGLRLVAQLTEQLNGSLAVKSEGGTAFTVAFPWAAAGQAQ